METTDQVKPPDVHPGVRISLPPDPPTQPSTRVTVVGMDIPFWDLVTLWVKVSIAAIPAVLFLFAIGFAVVLGLGLFGIILGGVGK